MSQTKSFDGGHERGIHKGFIKSTLPEGLAASPPWWCCLFACCAYFLEVLHSQLSEANNLRTFRRHRLEISPQHTPRSTAAIPTVGVQTCPQDSGYHEVSVAPRRSEPPVPKLPSMRRNMQAHRSLPGGRPGGCFSRVSERGQEMDGDRRHTLRHESITSQIFTWSRDNHMSGVCQQPRSSTYST
jgi:hypothetical protein